MRPEEKCGIQLTHMLKKATYRQIAAIKQKGKENAVIPSQCAHWRGNPFPLTMSVI